MKTNIRKILSLISTLGLLSTLVGCGSGLVGLQAGVDGVSDANSTSSPIVTGPNNQLSMAWNGKLGGTDHNELNSNLKEFLLSDTNGLIQFLPVDVLQYCPRYTVMDTDDKAQFWSYLLSVVAEQTSGFNAGMQTPVVAFNPSSSDLAQLTDDQRLREVLSALPEDTLRDIAESLGVVTNKGSSDVNAFFFAEIGGFLFDSLIGGLVSGLTNWAGGALTSGGNGSFGGIGDILSGIFGGLGFGQGDSSGNSTPLDFSNGLESLLGSLVGLVQSSFQGAIESQGLILFDELGNPIIGAITDILGNAIGDVAQIDLQGLFQLPSVQAGNLSCDTASQFYQGSDDVIKQVLCAAEMFTNLVIQDGRISGEKSGSFLGASQHWPALRMGNFGGVVDEVKLRTSQIPGCQ